ncbi:hypothetical protein [Nocardia jejuensis]|uniref:primosomal protein N' family DNA-binding protein n=1 Tax=Nocardia jejuensis TaxID=328049 RepID=UPI000B1FF1FD|nr:hypothetical protein [Nocardia jejuensis]
MPSPPPCEGERPIARVLPLLEPAHLDRDFDYLVPDDMSEAAQPGVRVRVRFSGRLVDGYILERLEKSSHTGKLVRLDRVVSAEQVLTPEILRLVTAVAHRYAGTRADVLRLAIPPRHARTEAEGTEPKPPRAKKRKAKSAPLAVDPGVPLEDPRTADPVDLDVPGDAELVRHPRSVDGAPASPPRIDPSAAPAGTPARPDEVSESATPVSVSGIDDAPGATEPGTVPASEEISTSQSQTADSRSGAHDRNIANSAANEETRAHPESGEPGSGAADSDATARVVVSGASESHARATAGRGERVPEVPGASDGGERHDVGDEPDRSEDVGDGGVDGAAGPAALGAESNADKARTWEGTAGSPNVPVGSEDDETTDTAVVSDGTPVLADSGVEEAVAAAAPDDGTAGGTAEHVAMGEIVGVPTVGECYPGWGRYAHGVSFLTAAAAGRAPRAAWQALPGEDWARRLAELAAVVAGSGRGVIVMVPDQRDLDRVLTECVALMGESAVGLAAGLGPSARYRRWLAALRGTAKVVVGTRSAVFAPVRDLGLIAIWDDGDDTYAEPRSPYPHAREVAMLRAHETGAGFVAGGFARTAEIQAVVESGWAHDLLAERSVLRDAMPRITAPGDTDLAMERDPIARAVRIPGLAFLAARRALAAGDSVLVQVPRRGYIPALSCAKCRTPARCRHCNGPLALPDDNSGTGKRNRGPARPSDAAATEWRPDGSAGQGTRPVAGAGGYPSAAIRGAQGAEAHSPACRWCGIVEAAFRCGACGSRALRAVVIGAARTAEELGRAFPGVPVRGSGGASILDTVPEGPQVVVATIGAEPRVPGGYAVGMLLDGWAMLGRADLRAAEDAMRRWMSAAALVRPTGQVIVMAEPALAVVQALLRWDPVGHARTELDERSEVRFPPSVRLAAIDGTTESIAELLSEAQLPEIVEVLGPVPLPPGARKPFSGGDSPAEVERMILRVDRAHGAGLSRALAAAQAVRSTHKSDAPLRVQIDPIDIG